MAAWGPSGLAVGYSTHSPWYGEGRHEQLLRFFRGPGNLSEVVERRFEPNNGMIALAWSPSGDRLAVGTWKGLLLLDRDLAGDGVRSIEGDGTGPARFPVRVQEDASTGVPAPRDVSSLGLLAGVAALGLVALAARRGARRP